MAESIKILASGLARVSKSHGGSKMKPINSYEMDHWVLLDTMSGDQINRLKTVIDKKTEPVEKAKNADSFLSMLNEETEKLG